MDPFIDWSGLNEILTYTPGNPPIWDRFLSCLAGLTGCETSYILIADLIKRENTHFLFSFNLAEHQQPSYASEFNNLDSFNNILAKNPLKVFSSIESKEEMEIDTINRSRWQYRFGFSIPCNSHHCLNLCLEGNRPFTQLEQRQIKQLLFSIITPFEIAIKAEFQHKINSQILHYTHGHFDAYVIVDRSLNILFSDALYFPIINTFNSMSISAEQIEFTNPYVKHRISSLMVSNTSASVYNQNDSCQITVIPVSSLDNLYDWECVKEGFILALTHDKQNNPVLDRLINVHNLSRCEATYALDFIQTPCIAEIAENNYRSQDTVRNHIKHIMQKMEVHNQAALMKKLITLSVL